MLEPSKGGDKYFLRMASGFCLQASFAGKGFDDFDLYISYDTPTGWSDDQLNLGPLTI